MLTAKGTSKPTAYPQSRPHPKAHSKMQEILNKFASFQSPPLEHLTAELARQLPTLADAVLAVTSDHWTKRLGGFILPVDSVSHQLIPSQGGNLLLRIYTPPGDGPFPVLLYFHGGGWVIANLDTYDSSCRALTDATDHIVVSVAYRQAPEHPFPAPVEDAWSAYCWLLANAATINGDPKCISVAGESAGGNLAAVLCLLARDKNIRQPDHQVLIYPVVDFNFDTDSYREFAQAQPLGQAQMRWFWDHYLLNLKDGLSPYASPLQANLRDLPSATIITAEIDPLCSEGEAYARKLSDAGVYVRHERYLGVTHEFFGMGSLLSEAKEAVSMVAEQLKMIRDSDEVSTRDQWLPASGEFNLERINIDITFGP